MNHDFAFRPSPDGDPGTGPPPPADTADRVRLGRRVVSLSVLRRFPGRWTDLYSHTKSEVGWAVCLCTNPGLRLVIRSRSGRYHLAGWPGDGTRHASACDFYKPAGPSGRTSYAEQAIVVSEEGTTIRLETPLQVRHDARSAAAPSDVGVEAGGESRRAVSLLGLMHHLWEAASLHEWRPQWKRRSWHVCYGRLAEQAASCTINERALADALYLVPPYQPARAETNAAALEKFQARLGRHDAIGHRGLLLGEIREVTPTPYGVRVALAHQRTPVFASGVLLERLERSYRTTLSREAGGDARRVMLGLVERTSAGNLSLLDAAIMLTNGTYLPAESMLEVRMAQHLVDGGRAFVKPLRYDATKEAVFPDFMLADTRRPVYVEVYGVQGRPEYEARKRAKTDYYREHDIPVISWEPGDPLPDLGRYPAVR